MNEQQTILLVENSEDDISFVTHACRAAHFKPSLQTVNNGEEAIAYLKGESIYANRDKFPLPAVILVDLKMPKMDGFEVLAWVRAQRELRRLPVIILTSSARAEDVERAFDLGASSYLVKPASMAALTAMICCLRDWLDYSRLPPPVEASPG
jgi:CheY-like chemotaxis protein